MRYVLVVGFFVLILLVGCSKSQTHELYTTLPASATDVETVGVMVDNGVESAVIAVPTKKRVVTTEGKTITRDVISWRAVSPWGVSPGEVISKQTPMSVAEGSRPGVNLSTEGAEITPSQEGAFKGGGGKWSWWDTIKQRLHDWSLSIGGILLLLGVGVTVLWFAVPGAKPILSAIGRAIASIFPIIGSVVENAVAKVKLGKPLAEVVEGTDEFLSKVKAEPTLTDAQKATVLALHKTAHDGAQDQATQDVVKELKT